MTEFDPMVNASPASAEFGRRPHEFWKQVGICIGLAALVLGIYAQTSRFEFVDYDDGEYVFENPHVLSGLTIDNLGWAFTTRHSANWHPLTWLSHMFDVEMFQSWPGGHHLTNAVIHAVTASLLFLALRNLTGNLWPSAITAALFAAHPQRVESVAWVAERKDMLSGFFFVLMLLTYARYIRRPSIGRYLLVASALACGLMSKPMLVTAPFVLLLLDYWPLRRWRTGTERSSAGWLILEKIPLFLMAGASIALTIWAQQAAISAADAISLGDRLGNAMNSYMAYIGQTFWPSGLAVLYPHPGGSLTARDVLLASIAVIAITLGAIAVRRRYPYFAVGWLWYLGMLVPVIGLVQVGHQARADRYTYLPQIGLFIALAWLAIDAVPAARLPRGCAAGALACVLLALSWCSWRQAKHWHDSETLFAHALACTTNNAIAHNNLGCALQRRDQISEAAFHLQLAAAIAPCDPINIGNYGVVLARLGRLDEAIVYLRRAIALDPKNVNARVELGKSLRLQNHFDEAEEILQQALELGPRSAVAHTEYGILRAQQGQLDDAVSSFEQAVMLAPTHIPYRKNLALALYKAHRPHESLDVLRESLRLQPDHLASLRLAGWIASTSEDPTARSAYQAVTWAEQAQRLTAGNNPLDLDLLAAARAEAGQFSEAIEAAKGAYKLAGEKGHAKLASKILAHVEMFQSRKALRLPPSDLD